MVCTWGVQQFDFSIYMQNFSLLRFSYLFRYTEKQQACLHVLLIFFYFTDIKNKLYTPVSQDEQDKLVGNPWKLIILLKFVLLHMILLSRTKCRMLMLFSKLKVQVTCRNDFHEFERKKLEYWENPSTTSMFDGWPESHLTFYMDDGQLQHGIKEVKTTVCSLLVKSSILVYQIPQNIQRLVKNITGVVCYVTLYLVYELAGVIDQRISFHGFWQKMHLQLSHLKVAC